MPKKPLDQLKTADTNILKDILKQKQIFGSAKDDATKQAASAEADRLRQTAGIEAGSQGLLSAPELSKLIESRGNVAPGPTPQVQGPTPQVQGPTPDQLRNQILQAQEQQKINDLARSTEKATQSQMVARQAVEPKIKGLKSQASVATQVGQKRLKDIFASTGMAAGTGAAKQIAAEQGLQSQLGALDVQKADELAQIDRNLADIQSEKAFLERQIRAGTATAQAEAQLADLQAQQEARAREAEIKNEQDFRVFETNLKQFNAIELANLQNSLTQDNKVLDAEIQNLRDQQLFEQDVQLKEQARINMERLEGIKNSNAIKLESIKSSNQLQQIGARNSATQQQILLRDQLSGARQQQETENTSLDQNTIEKAIENNLQNKIQQAINEAPTDYLNGGKSPLSLQQQKEVVLEQMVGNPEWFGDAATLRNVLSLYNIDPQELADYEDWRERALSDQAFE